MPLFNSLVPPIAHNWLLTTFLLSVRLSVLFMLTPVLNGNLLPAPARMIIVLALAATLAASLPSSAANQSIDGSNIFGAVLNEVVIGLAFALGVSLVFAAFQLAGGLLDVQIGYGIAEIFDPVTRRTLPVLSSAFNQLGVLIFFALDGHHALLRLVALSLHLLPPGQILLGTGDIGGLTAILFKPLLHLISTTFWLGFAIVAPVVFCLLLAEFTFGVMARNFPQINMFIIAVPMKIVIGLAVLALWLGSAGNIMSRLIASMFDMWSGLL